MRVAAFHNGYYVALCNRVGKEEKLTFAHQLFLRDRRLELYGPRLSR